jgi:hypothetical protein
MVGVPENGEIMTIVHRGSLAPQRGEGLRVRGETTQIVENQIHYRDTRPLWRCQPFQLHGDA